MSDATLSATPAWTRRRTLATIGALALAAPTHARPTRYRLDPANSRVGFTYVLNGASQQGTMPVDHANILIDPQNLQASSVDVSLNARKARTGFVFATQALTGTEVLDTARFPHIRFVSDRVRLGPEGRISDGASISGSLTIRDRTRRVTFDAGLFRPAGTTPEDLNVLTVRLTGAINRSDFGAAGFPDLVADRVGLDVTARILRT